MTALEQLKVRLGISGTSQDDKLTLLLTDAQDMILDVIGRDELPARLSSVQQQLAVIAYNKQGVEGSTARAEGGISQSLIEDLPADMQRRLRNYPRLVRTIEGADSDETETG